MSKQETGYQDAGEQRRPGNAEIAIVLVIIAIVAVVAWILFGQETEQILQTVSGSV